MTSPTQRRHDELVALLTEIRDRLPEPEGVNAVEDEPTDITEEPPVGSQVTDGMGDVWERREEGWALWWAERPGWIADLGGGELDPWPVVRGLAPLRLTTDEDRKRVGLPLPMRGEPAPADDGLAEWERELLRPATCCGKCPPIAGGGYDCTCVGNPRCDKAEAERDEPAPDVDPDAVTISLPRDDLTKPTVLRLAAADLRRKYHLGMGGLPRSLPGTLDALADALDLDTERAES